MELIEQARTFVLRGELDEAAKDYRQVLAHQPHHTEALCELGTVCLLQDRAQEALALFEKSLDTRRDNFDALLGRANSLFKLQRYSQAISAFEEALKINSASSEAHHNRGAALGAMGRHAQALEEFEHAINLKPDYFDAHNSRGNALRALGRWNDALRSFSRARKLRPKDPGALLNQSLALRSLKRYDEALARLDQAIEIRPGLIDAHVKRADVLQKLKRPDDALESSSKALSLNPGSADLQLGHGLLLARLRRYAEAVSNYDHSLKIRPGFTDALIKRAQAFIEMGCPEGALRSFDEALTVRSDLIEALVGRGYVLSQLQRWHEAMECYERVIRLEPTCVEAQGNLGLMLLTLGDLRAGWEALEWRWKQPNRRKDLRKYPQPRWLGQVPVAGKRILLYHEQGMGDTIQFARYAELLTKDGARVILNVQAPLVTLMQGLPGIEAVVGPKDALPSFDLQCPLMSLPLALGTTLETVPARVPYLHAPSDRISRWSDLLGKPTMPRVGIAWSGNSRHGNDRNRSIALEQLLPLLSCGVELISLQKDVRDADRTTLNQNPKIRDFGNELIDFAETAALMSLLDLVISVDTAPAHLAGALGKQVWILLPFSPDWRWLLNREDNPWYPSARLFRQPVIGDWTSVIERIVQDLRKSFAMDH